MKKYLKYELKRCFFPIGCLALIATVLYATPVITSSITHSASGTLVWVISTIGGLLAACVPIWLFSYRMKKRSVDLFYSLPLSHKKIMTVKFIVGLVAVFAPYTIAYWIGAFAVMSRVLYRINAVWYLPQYFASLIPIYCIYAISTFVFTRANSILDGIIFVVFWTCAALLVMGVLSMITATSVIVDYDDYNGVVHDLKYFINPFYYTPWSPLDFITTHFQEHIAGYMNIHTAKYSAIDIVNIVLGFTLTAALAAGSTVGLFLLEGRTKAENVGQVSESLFGYKVMIPLYIVCLATISPSPLLYAFLAVGAFTISAIYKRTPKIGSRQAVILVCSAIAGIVLFMIF